MTTFQDKIDGDFTFTGAASLLGMVTGRAVAADGARLQMNGMICEGLTVLSGAVVVLDGTVRGDVVVRGGRVLVNGTVHGAVIVEAGDAEVGAAAVVDGGVVHRGK